MPEVNVSVRMDSGLKNSSQELFSGLGMDLGTAITVFCGSHCWRMVPLSQYLRKTPTMRQSPRWMSITR